MSSKQDPSLEDRLRELLDKHEIQECLLRYCRGIDRHDADLAQSAYHDDALDDHGTYIGSGYGLVDWANGFHEEVWVRHQHYITNTLIELDGDTAHAETYYFMGCAKKDDFGAFHGGGRYVDRFERRNGRWGIVDRVCTLEWFDEPWVMERTVPLGLAISSDKDDVSYVRPLRVEREARVVFGPGSSARETSKIVPAPAAGGNEWGRG